MPDSEIDYKSRYELLVGLCRELTVALRQIKKIVPLPDDLPAEAMRIIKAEKAIDDKLREWQELGR